MVQRLRSRRIPAVRDNLSKILSKRKIRKRKLKSRVTVYHSVHHRGNLRVKGKCAGIVSVGRNHFNFYLYMYLHHRSWHTIHLQGGESKLEYFWEMNWLCMAGIEREIRGERKVIPLNVISWWNRLPFFILTYPPLVWGKVARDDITSFHFSNMKKPEDKLHRKTIFDSKILPQRRAYSAESLKDFLCDGSSEKVDPLFYTYQ